MNDLAEDLTTESLLERPKSALSRRVRTLTLIVVGFFWVSGGIYGNEELVSAAPPLVVFLFTALVPLVFSLPIALVTAELATAFPSEGGQVAWVEQALGPVVGGHNAYWVWLTNLLDASVYPLMAVEYLREEADLGPWAGRGVCAGLVGGIALMGLAGIDWIGKLQAVVFTATLLPCVLFIVVGVPHMKPAAWVAVDGGPTDWGLLLSWTLWLYSGFSSLGCMAGEVERPKTTYLTVIGVLFPLVLALNLLPFLVSVSLDADRDHYHAGYFRVLAQRLGGSWLRVTFTAGANVALVGLYQSQILAAERSLYAVALERGLVAPPTADADAPGRSRASRAADWLRAAPAAGGVPRAHVLFNAFGVLLLIVALPYRALVEVEMMLYCISALLLLYSFVALRRGAHADVPRPFKLPGGTRAAAAALATPSVVCALSLAANLADAEKAAALAGVVALGGVGHLGWWARRRLARRAPTSAPS